MAAVFREEAGRLTGWLMRSLGDFSVAEEIVQDALVAALEQWSAEVVPESPRAWLRTVARRRAIDRLRREVRFRERLAQLSHTGQEEDAQPDNRLELIFTCCHPALAPEAQIALTLRAVCGPARGRSRVHSSSPNQPSPSASCAPGAKSPRLAFPIASRATTSSTRA